MLKQEVETFPGPSDVYPMPLPLLTRTHTWVTTAPIYLADIGYAEEPTAGGYRKRSVGGRLMGSRRVGELAFRVVVVGRV